MITKFIPAIGLLLLLAPAYGQDQPALEDMTPQELEIEAQKAGYQMAQQFSWCAALWDAMRDFSQALGQPDMAQVFNDQSNGAELTAEVFAKAYAKIEKYEMFVKGQYDTSYPRYRSLLKHGGAEDSEVQAAVFQCNMWQHIQNQVVDEVRKKAYGADTSTNQWVK